MSLSVARAGVNSVTNLELVCWLERNLPLGIVFRVVRLFDVEISNLFKLSFQRCVWCQKRWEMRNSVSCSA